MTEATKMAGSPYSTAAWFRLRAAQLRLEPTCRPCREVGRVSPATIVDHVQRWRSGASEAEQRKLFHDPQNLQSACKTCHDSLLQRRDKNPGRPVWGSRLDGMPVSSDHPWFAEGAEA